jgi:inositol transporter-like SP family MFS transporter
VNAAHDHKWRNTILAGLANYIDAGSIVAGSAALALWKAQYGLSDTFLGLIAAFSANAISAGVGALIGGILCDRFGRKKIYQYDMIFYAFGMLFLVFASAPWMIVLGFVLVGLAGRRRHSRVMVADRRDGARRPARQAQRGRAGAVVPRAGGGAGRVPRARAVRRARSADRVRASRGDRARADVPQGADARVRALGRRAAGSEPASPAVLLQPRYLKSILFLAGMYGFWNLWAGTNGFFFPYILRTVGDQSQGMSVALQAGGFLLSMLSIYFIFMKLADRVNQRLLFGVRR